MVSPQQFYARLFHEFFPPPRFLEMPAVGLDISDDAVTALELVRRKDAYAVGRFARRPLPEGVIAGGYVNDKEKAVAELVKLQQELGLDFVNASLSEEKAYLFKTTIPRVARKEIRSVLEFKLEENVPIPASDAIFDYTVVSQTVHAPAEHLDVGVTVLPEKVVATYVELLHAAGLSPLSFEIEAQAVARSVIAPEDKEAYLVAHIGERQTGLFIVSDAVVHFTSTIAIGGEHLTDAIAKYLSVGSEEARAIKREHAKLADRKNMDLFFSVMNTLSALKDEVNKLLSYWHSHKELGGEAGKRISRMLLTGRDAGLTGLDEYLSRALELPVEVGNVWRNVCSFTDYIPPILRDDALLYAAAVGLALPNGH